MQIPRQPKQLTLAFLFAVVLLLAAGVEASAQSPCRVGFLSGNAPANIDGDNAITSGTTREWSDASVIASGDPCFGWLLDQDNAGPGKSVRVASKRYTRSGQHFIGFYVEVMDSSASGPLSSGSLASGERFIVQFDPNDSGGPELGVASALDFRVVVEHAWAPSGSQITDARATLSDSNFRSPCGGGTQNWRAGAAAAGLVVAARIMTGGYKFELEIPLTVIGISGAFPTSEIGIAFAVINDYGGCLSGTSGASCPNSGGAGFPSDIPITTLNNPASGCHLSWIIPNNWAGSSSTAPTPGHVTIKRIPEPWDSMSLLAFPCGSSAAGYTYFPTHPCKVELKAWLDNTTGTIQDRNVVFLWIKAGTGAPNEIKFISLVPVSVAAGLMQGPFSSGLWSGIPTGHDNHPCVRAYILPAVLRPEFDGPEIRAITDFGHITTMVSTYGLIEDNWAQKNITRHDSATDCDAGSSCFAARNDPNRLPDASGERVASIPAETAPVFASGGPRVLQTRDSVLPIGVLPALTNVTESAQKMPDPPVFGNPGHRISMAPGELRTFSRDNVVVQVRTFETEQPTTTSESYYRFARNTGGVIHLFPVKMLETRGFIPFEFDVTGMPLAPATSSAEAGPRILNMGIDLLAPPSIAANVQIAIDASPRPIRPGETQVIRGLLILTRPGGGPGFKRWGLSFHAGVSIPQGNFSNLFNPGPNAAVDLEYRINKTFSLEGIYGIHHFRGATFGPVSVAGTNVHQFSFNGKVYGSTSPVRPFFNFGGGGYKFESDDKLYGGLNIGGGVQFDVTPTVAVEGVYNFHNVFTSGSQTRFSGVQGGVRFRF